MSGSETRGKGKGWVESDRIWEINPLFAQVRLLDYFVLDRDREKHEFPSTSQVFFKLIFLKTYILLFPVSPFLSLTLSWGGLENGLRW